MPDAGWYPDPSTPQQVRYWDGAGWTEHVADAPPTTAAPVAAPAAPAAPTAAPDPAAAWGSTSQWGGASPWGAGAAVPVSPHPVAPSTRARSGTSPVRVAMLVLVPALIGVGAYLAFRAVGDDDPPPAVPFSKVSEVFASHDLPCDGFDPSSSKADVSQEAQSLAITYDTPTGLMTQGQQRQLLDTTNELTKAANALPDGGSYALVWCGSSLVLADAARVHDIVVADAENSVVTDVQHDVEALDVPVQILPGLIRPGSR